MSRYKPHCRCPKCLAAEWRRDSIAFFIILVVVATLIVWSAAHAQTITTGDSDTYCSTTTAVSNRIKKLYPGVTLIDPALKTVQVARAVNVDPAARTTTTIDVTASGSTACVSIATEPLPVQEVVPPTEEPAAVMRLLPRRAAAQAPRAIPERGDN